jgi:hypothetical protein
MVETCGGYMGYPPSKLLVYLFSYLVLWRRFAHLSQVWEHVLVLPGRNSLTCTSLLLVSFFKENGKKQPAGSQQNDKRERLF